MNHLMQNQAGGSSTNKMLNSPTITWSIVYIHILKKNPHILDVFKWKKKYPLIGLEENTRNYIWDFKLRKVSVCVATQEEAIKEKSTLKVKQNKKQKMEDIYYVYERHMSSMNKECLECLEIWIKLVS